MVIDVDGEEGLKSLQEAGIELEDTVIVETGGGGFHYWFKYPGIR